MVKRVAVAAAVVALLLVAPLAAVEAGAPLGGLTHEQAATAAREAIHEDQVTERWALPGPFLLFRAGSTDAVSPWRRMVWAVSFSGTFQSASCGPAPLPGQTAHCPSPGHTVNVIVDYVSGEFIQADFGP